MTAAQLEKTCRLVSHVKPPEDESPEKTAARRYVTCRESDTDMVTIEAHLRPDEAALLLRAIDACRETGDRADGLVAVAELALSGGERTKKPVEINLTIDGATLTGHAETGQGINPEAARRLCCDAGMTPVVTDGEGQPLDVGRKTRTVPPAIRRALQVRDQGCRFPGCTNQRFVDAHHLEHWIDGGETKLSNLVSLCTRHHVYVHEHDFGVSPAELSGHFEFRDPRGRLVVNAPLPAAPVPSDWATLKGRCAGGADVSAERSRPLWDGERIDHEACALALLPD
jgi:hypothetical protein